MKVEKFTKMSVTAYLKALPKARPRVTRRGTFMPTKYSTFKRDFATLWCLENKQKIEGDVKVSIRFYFSTKKRGDIDNLAGAILDALNGIAFDDDRQVVSLTCNIVNSGTNKIDVLVEEFTNV